MNTPQLPNKAAEAAQATLASGQSRYSPTVHLLAVTLTAAVFPLIWVGGLVTTYDAGMAVPDWPGTYGWNMFAYPASTWLFGPFDLLVEHSHRLLGALAGFLAIGLVIAAFRRDYRRWFRWWSVGVLLAVVAQGILGGIRVVLDQRTAAMIHGCTGPLFFAIATATAVMCSKWWFAIGQIRPESDDPAAKGSRKRLSAEAQVAKAGQILAAGASSRTVYEGRTLPLLASFLVLAGYSQLILGAQLRHVTAAISHSSFMGLVHTHLTLAVVVALLALVFFGFSLNRGSAEAWIARPIGRPAGLLVSLVFLQIGLGIATWIVNYALPWTEDSLAGYTILSKGYWESMIVTAHMATGSLIISLATLAAVRAWRVFAACKR